jgi:hypothetical protein
MVSRSMCWSYVTCCYFKWSVLIILAAAWSGYILINVSMMHAAIKICREMWLVEEIAVERWECSWFNYLLNDGLLTVYVTEWVIRNCSIFFAGPSGRAVYAVGLRLLACWDCGFKSHQGHGCLPVVSVVCCQVDVSTSADHSSRGVLPTVMRRCVWSRKLMNEKVLAHWGLSRQK